jgi:hypothetical protein
VASDGIATESVTTPPILAPHGRLRLEPADEAVALSSDLSHRLQKAFARGAGHGLLQLGAAEVGTVLPPVFGYWREFGARYVSAVCGQPDLDTSRSHTIIPPLDELEKLAAAAPPMLSVPAARRKRVVRDSAAPSTDARREGSAAGGTKTLPPHAGERTARAAPRTATRAPASSDVKRAAISERMKKYWRERRGRER